MKKLTTVILAIIGIIASTLVVQFGWNKIMITIIDVHKISFWQAFGMHALLAYILPKEKVKNEDEELFEHCNPWHFERRYLCRSALAY